MEAAAELQQRADTSADGHLAERRPHDAGDDLQERRLARAVLADDADRFATAQLQIDRLQRAEMRHVAAAEEEREERPQAVAAGGDTRIVLGDAGEMDQGLAHGCCASPFSSSWKRRMCSREARRAPYEWCGPTRAVSPGFFCRNRAA